MTKLFLFLLIIIGIVFIVVNTIKRAFKNLFKPFERNDNHDKNSKINEEEIVYKKEDIVIYKGDSSKKNESKS
jgi:hypothetical protein